MWKKLFGKKEHDSEYALVSNSDVEMVDVDLETVRDDGMELEHISQQTIEICLAAVKQNGFALKFVELQTPEICKAAVQQNGLALQFVHEKTSELCKLAMVQNPAAMEFFVDDQQAYDLLGVENGTTELPYVTSTEKHELDTFLIRKDITEGKVFTTEEEQSVIDILTDPNVSSQRLFELLSSLTYNCYNKTQYNSLVKYLPFIYKRMQNLGNVVSNMVKKDIFEAVFRKRNPDFQQANIRIFCEEMTRWMNIPENNAMEIRVGYIGFENYARFNVDKVLYWIKDILEIDRPISRKGMFDYLWSWIDRDVLPQEATIRERLMWRFHACQLILDYSYQPLVHEVSQFLLRIGGNEDYSTYIRGDAMDILLRNKIPEEYQNQITATMHELAQAREDERRNQVTARMEMGADEILHGANFGGAIAGSTFDSSQTVHETGINDALKENLITLNKDPEIRGNTIDTVCEKIVYIIKQLDDYNNTNHKYIQAIRSLHRFQTDPSVFSSKRLRLANILVLVWNRIERSEHKLELTNRLASELSEAYNTCASGHASRCVATLIGYFDDLKQSSSFETQLKDNIVARINKTIKESPQDVQSDLYIGLAFPDSPEYKVLMDYLAEKRQSIFDELLTEFVPDYLQKDTFEIVFEKTWFK